MVLIECHDDSTRYSLKVEVIMILNRSTVAAEGEKVVIGLDWMP